MINTKTNMIDNENCKCETQIKGSPKNIIMELAILTNEITKRIADQVDESQAVIINTLIDLLCDMAGEEE